MHCILIVEDKEIVYCPIADYFRKSNWNVDIAEDGEIAFQMLINITAKKYDCMLLDFRMSSMNGDELLKALRQNSIIPPSTILLSAYTDEVNIEELKSMGVVKVLKKPCDPAVIVNTALNVVLGINCLL